MKKRVLSLLLIVFLIFPNISAVAVSSDDIMQFMSTKYAEALGSYSNFNGSCGACVASQLLALKINTYYVGHNGNNMYDVYANMNTTSGGYSVASFPASSMSMSDFLYYVNKLNTSNAYTFITLGFQKGSNSSDGQTYGHTLLIYSICGGYVYYTESWGTTVRKESISDFLYTNRSIDYGNGIVSFVYEGAIWFYNSQSATVPTPPSTPIVKSIKTESATSISIKWDKASNASSYRVRRRKQGEEDYVTAADAVTATVFTDTGLEPATKYYYKIFAVNSAGSSVGSERAEATTLCDAPAITYIKPVSTSSIFVQWNRVEGASSYRVRRRKSGEEDYVTAAESLTSTVFTDTGLEPGVKYFYKIFAVNDAGSSMGSERAEMYTLFTLDIDPQGGTRKETTDILTAEFEQGETKKVSFPTKEGYKFVGWALDFEGSGHINGYWGIPIHCDPTFENSYDSISIYNKSENDTVIIKRTSRDSTCGIAGTYMLKIATTGIAKPGLGGFRQLTDSKSGGIFYHVIYAKIPKGYTIEQANNACGDGATFEWITSKEGTDEWKPYVYKVTCGIKGTFSTFGHVYLSGPDATEDAPVKWNVGYSEVFDATDVNIAENNYKMGSGNATVYALWEANTYNITFNANGGKTPVASKNVTYASTYGTLPTPEKDGYLFNGWYTETNGGTLITSSTKVTTTSAQTLYAQWESIIPYTQTTVSKSDTGLTVDTELHNAPESYTLYVAGYQNNKLVTLQEKKTNEPIYILEDDIDEIRVMLWDTNSLFAPLCDAERIPSSQWVIQ